MSAYPALEPQLRRPTRWLRGRRLHLALGIGAAETIAVAVTGVDWRWAVLVAVGLLAVHLLVGRNARHASVRHASSVAAGSQLVPVLVAVALAFLTGVAVVGVLAFVLVIVAMLSLDRR